MNLEVVYCWPALASATYWNYAERFVTSCVTYPAMVGHSTTIVCNGAPADAEAKGLFSILPNVKFIQHDNSGYDIGAFQLAASGSSADMIVFFGVSAYVRKGGWLVRMAGAWQRNGHGQYGSMANRGVGPVHKHLRTTGFWTSPALFNAYPERITRPEQRHPFEHGPNCFTAWIERQGLRNWLVTNAGDYLWADWDNAPGGFHRNSQENMLTGDHLSEPPFYHCA